MPLKPDTPAFNFIQTGTGPVRNMNNTILPGSEPTPTGDPMDEFDQNIIIAPDFLQDLENNIDQIQQDFSSIVPPEPVNDSEVIRGEPQIIEQIKKPDFSNQLVNNPQSNPAIQTYFSKKKYNIVDIFTFEYEGEPESAEANPIKVDAVKVSYNQDFGNLRITFNQVPEVAKYNNVLFSQKMKLLIAATIYPTSAFKALNTFEGFNCTEVLINKTGEKWEKERPVIAIQQLENGEFYVWITDVTKEDTQYVYHFAGWQSKAFKYCLEYCYGDGVGTRK